MVHNLPVVMLLASHELFPAADSTGLAQGKYLVYNSRVRICLTPEPMPQTPTLYYLLESRSIKPHDVSLFSTTLYVQGDK